MQASGILNERKIGPLARRFKWMLRGLFLLLAVAALGPADYFGGANGIVGLSIGEPPPKTEVEFSQSWPTLFSFIATTIITVSIWWVLDRLFTAYQRGEVFTLSNAKRVSLLGWLALTLALTSLVASITQAAIEPALLVGEHGVGIPMIIVDFNLAIFLAGAATIAIGRILKHAAHMQEDVDLTV